ncbi:Cyclin-dependent kinase 20 [Saguinus oedipus]|uniref:cyclin-dependent kinase n=1 Tax=Saguinus oedipus TaxID=9490 RepID=A0ABQ9WCV8_SAGOE|nr:Cyclin-dependent kinase 20 [Saguinus oedipus]
MPTSSFPRRWYRAPELLYGARQYDQGIDLWSDPHGWSKGNMAHGFLLGSEVSELFGGLFRGGSGRGLLNGSPLFPGENDIEQLCCVLRILGTLSPQVWPELAELPDYNKISFKEQAPVPLEEVLPDASPQALDLLSQFLLYRSLRRIAASKRLSERVMGRDQHQTFGTQGTGTLEQALLHFTASLPAHPSELLIHQRPGGPAPKAHPGPPYIHDFHVDRPLEELLLNPELIWPFIPEG